MSLITSISGERDQPETHKLNLFLPFAGGKIFVEIPAPGLLFAPEDNGGRKWDLARRAIDALRAEIPAA